VCVPCSSQRTPGPPTPSAAAAAAAAAAEPTLPEADPGVLYSTLTVHTATSCGVVSYPQLLRFIPLLSDTGCPVRPRNGRVSPIHTQRAKHC
jgi:hypothetical protein